MNLPDRLKIEACDLVLLLVEVKFDMVKLDLVRQRLNDVEVVAAASEHGGGVYEGFLRS